MNPAQLAAKARALDVIARVDASLAEPRAIGEVWEAPEPAPAPVTIERVSAVSRQTAAPQAGAVTWQSIDALIKVIGREVGERINVETRRADDLEKRLEAVEALLARAQGKTQ